MRLESIQSATEHQTNFKRVLGLRSLVLFGLIYMVPLTVFTTYGIVTEISGARLPLSYIVTLFVMIFTARSYGLMSKAFPFAGSVYTYAQKSFGPDVGFLTGWMLLFGYILVPMVNYLVIGSYFSSVIPSVSSSSIILIAITIVTILNIIGTVSVARANIFIIGIQAMFIVTFIILALSSGLGAEVDLLAPFIGDGSTRGFSPVASGAAILCLSFLGFDSITTLAEETKDPTRNLPRAIKLITVLGGLLFILLSYISYLAYPEHLFADKNTAALDVMTHVGGNSLKIFFVAAFLSGVFGSALVSHVTVVRILYAMGRDGVISKTIFGNISERFNTPITTVLVVSMLSLMALWIELTQLSEMVSFGALVAFSLVNLSVIKHYYIGKGPFDRSDTFNYLVLPLIGFGLVFWLWTTLHSSIWISGLAWFIVGIIYLAYITGGFLRRAPMLDLRE